MNLLDKHIHITIKYNNIFTYVFLVLYVKDYLFINLYDVFSQIGLYKM